MSHAPSRNLYPELAEPVCSLSEPPPTINRRRTLVEKVVHNAILFCVSHFLYPLLFGIAAIACPADTLPPSACFLCTAIAAILFNNGRYLYALAHYRQASAGSR